MEKRVCQSPNPAVTKIQAQMSSSKPEPRNIQFRLMKATKRSLQVKLHNSVTSSQSDSKSSSDPTGFSLYNMFARLTLSQTNSALFFTSLV